ncbi:glycosyltransferase [Pseudanabaena sp. FACHB-1998]|uniref:glycosyltransferase n=1 Tax=Pseudanabaena sp. FACHB-1998 TaxID=2692858 RepID=UPI001681AF27|nr:glycosyltransferase [Pseudanabaena sp. FACHB-1998]MBD2176902.1 glycosyltransferase [Pseudanabaena sp. FACHB-1998]
MKIALVHDYLTQRGGAERVFELLCKHFPTADIYTSVYDRQNTIDLGDRPVHTTFLQNIPATRKYFRLFAPFYYTAFSALNLQEYDLILSSSASFAKGVQKRPEAIHICFCHNITRFLWDTNTYLREYGAYSFLKPVIELLFKIMRQQDIFYAQAPDYYIANSSTVAKRIEETYHKDALVINYPIDDRRFTFCDRKEDYCLVSSRHLSYKRLDIIIEAFNSLGMPLIITGEGPETKQLQAKSHSNIQFLGHVSDRDRCDLMAKAKFVIVAALEDYGLVPIEANASGTPVIAYGAGGVMDTQISGMTGLLFEQQTSESLKNAIIKAQEMPWNYAKIREHAISNFSEVVFFQKVDRQIEKILNSKATIASI